MAPRKPAAVAANKKEQLHIENTEVNRMETNVQKRKPKTKADDGKPKKRRVKATAAIEKPKSQPIENVEQINPITSTPVINTNSPAQVDSIRNDVSKKRNAEKRRKIRNLVFCKTISTVRNRIVPPIANSTAINNSSIILATRKSNAALNCSLQEKQTVCSLSAGKLQLTTILNPIEQKEFMTKNWETSPLYIRRQDPNFYYEWNVSMGTIDETLRHNVIDYTKYLNIIGRDDRECLGRALPDKVWSAYRDGCTIELLNMQTYLPSLHKLSATLQEFFYSMVGVNIYLTPSNGQGFAPRYFDDMETFVLQIDGKSQWFLYEHRLPNDALLRESIDGFNKDRVGSLVLEKTLEPGDLLYFPRGTIHQAKTVPEFHSIHITLIVYQKTSYGGLLEKLIKQAVRTAIDSEFELRCGLPIDIWQELGLAHSNSPSERRQQLIARTKELFSKVIDHVDYDDGVDKMALIFQHDALPPVLSSHEINQTTFGSAATTIVDGQIRMSAMDENTEVRLLRANIMRLIAFEDTFRLYYYADNSKEFHEYDMNYVEVSDVKPLQHLINAYPRYMKIGSLPTSTDDALDIVRDLWGRGFLMTRAPLNFEN